MSDSLKVAHFLWATWAICSQSLNCVEGSEQITHSRSFDLSKMREWAMSKWANSQPCLIDYFSVMCHYKKCIFEKRYYCSKNYENAIVVRPWLSVVVMVKLHLCWGGPIQPLLPPLVLLCTTVITKLFRMAGKEEHEGSSAGRHWDKVPILYLL